ncbi:GDSL-type esterase/lipase family protein [Paenibacillus solisilvae]|uniref:GDSL-type esterase/lipase family protein n=1 Tax=Paenibacillus solisilvae TaxID=2486751 RepID=A0ABW0VRG5_9BACL
MQSNRSSVLWRSISLAALISTLLLLFGFGYSVKDMLWPKKDNFSGAQVTSDLPKQTSLGASKEIRMMAIGDSITKGTGDSTGEGYVMQVIPLLQKKFPDVPVKLNNNLAINGLRADQLAHLLKNDKGYRYALTQSNLIVFTIGGNDLFQIATGESASEATGELNLAKLKAELPKGISRLKTVVDLLHEINPNAHVVYMGLYNPFFDIKELRDGSLEVQNWNQQAYSLIHSYPNMTMIPTFDLFERTLTAYISSDHFHPNHDGYAQIASRIVQSLE